jgi:xanthine dehydrogenase YagR molybdenum-binding subunit
MPVCSPEAREIIGEPVSRVDGIAKVRGRADYAAERDLQCAVHAAILGSRIASGRIRSIDATSLEIMPGVLHVLSHENAMPLKACAPIPEGSVVETFRPFQDDLIRYAGQPVAAVIAEMLEQATEACLRLVVNYEQRKAVADLDDPEALPAQMQPSGEPRGDAQKTFAKAAVRIEQSYSTPREYNSAIEMHSTVALWDADGGLTVWEPSQWIEGARRTLSEWFSVPFEKVRVLSPFVGGGFGSKVTLHPHSAIAVMAAKQVGRPVKLSLTRAQNFTAHGGRPATRQHISLGADEDGRLRAVLHNNVNETSIDDDYDESGEDLARVAYASPDFSARAGVVHANIITPGWMRAPGEAVGAYALECAMDELAYQLQMDPIELRLRNLADHDPENGKPWSTRRLREAYQAGAEAFGWAERSPEPRSMRRGSELVGWGMAGGCFRCTARWPRRASASVPTERSRWRRPALISALALTPSLPRRQRKRSASLSRRSGFASAIPICPLRRLPAPPSWQMC